MLVEDQGWRSLWVEPGRAACIGRVDVAVLSLEALDALPLVAPTASSLIVDVPEMAFETGRPAAGALSGLSNRLAGVVVHSGRAEAWARRAVGPNVPVWKIPAVAARRVELAATSIRFGLDMGRLDGDVEAMDWPDRFELWFAEPGDCVESDEVEALAREWSPTDAARVVIAPKRVRLWLEQRGLDCVAHDWSPERIEAALGLASACVFMGRMSSGQSRRRAVARRMGRRSLDGLPDRGHDPIDVGQSWSLALNNAAPDQTSGTGSDGRILLFADLVQDLDLALPLIDAMQGRALDVAVSTWLYRRSPRVGAELARRGITPSLIDRESVLQGKAPDLNGIGAVLAPAESTLSAHARTHALFRRARALAIPTFSLQHGLENVGLSRIDFGQEETPTLISDHLFVWAGHDAPPPPVRALRPRLVHTGRVPAVLGDTPELKGALAGFDRVIAVFENLHWNRYPERWRRSFLGDCVQFAAEQPETLVVLKPHHTGLWSVRHAHLFPDWPNNLILADPTDPFWEPYTAPALLNLADLVITTPSTVALDAAQARKPVAVASYGLALPTFEPLPMIQSLMDWRAFATAADSPEGARARAMFVARNTHGDAPVRDMVHYIDQAMRERAHARRRRKEMTS